MIDLGREIASAVRVDWNAMRSQAAEAGMRVRRRRRAIARATFTATAVAFVAIGWAAWSRRESPTLASQSPQLPPKTPTLGGASSATSHEARVVTAPTLSPAAPSGPGAVPATPPASAAPTTASAATTPGEKPAHRPVIKTAPKFASSHYERPLSVETWRELAREGNYDKAYEALADVDVRDIPDELLLAADVKRLSHHPGEAVAPLRQLLRDHASDSRAPLAAFTLGRVLLELDRPGEAAEAFGRADLLAPDGPLAEDAVARQVEALARAGDARDAHIVAEQYVARFPHGRKLKSVRRLGGVP